MLFDRPGDIDEATNEHQCFVAGQQPDGGLTGICKDVGAHPENRFVAYVPRCGCGWTGPPFSSTPGGYAACEQLWRDKHLAQFLRAREPRSGRPLTTWELRVIPGGT